MENFYSSPQADIDGATPRFELSAGKGISKVLVVLFTLIIVIDLAGIASDFYQLKVLQDLKAGIDVPDAVLDKNDQIFATIGNIHILTSIATGICFLIWIYNAYKNLILMGMQHLKFSPGWSVGYFFIPILNLFRPYQVVKEIWQNCAPEKEIKLYGKDMIDASAKINWWWTFFILVTITSRVSASLMVQANDADQFITATIVTLITDILTIIGAITAIKMIKAVDNRQIQKNLELSSSSTI